MAGTGEVAGVGTPHGGSEDQHWQEEEDAGYFQPENAADATKRAQESADTAGDATAGLPGNSSGSTGEFRLSRRDRARRSVGGGFRAG